MPPTATAAATQPVSEQRLQQTLAANLAAMERSHPEVARLLNEALQAVAAGDEQYRIAPDPMGGMTVFQRSGGGFTSLSPLQKTVPTVSDLFRNHHDHFRDLPAIALLSAGDGRILRWLADHPPRKFMDAELCVYIIEPDPARLLHAMMLHDFTGPHGPIDQQRFIWSVGEQWAGQIRESMQSRLMLPAPRMYLGLPAMQKAAQNTVEQIAGDINKRAAERLEAFRQWVDGRTDDDVAALLGESPPRPPRLLLMTSRLTTVLQYSTADIADAFESLGWETRTLIEQQPHEKHSFASMVDALDSFRPDVVLTLNYLRRDLPTLPPSVPHICWIQDHMPNLTTTEAGRAVDRRQFIVTAQKYKYAGEYDYPPRQCIEIGKLTRPVKLPDSWTCDGDDLVYVSHAPEQPEQRLEQLFAECRTGEERAFMEHAGRALIDAYNEDAQQAASGASPLQIQTRRQLREFVERTEQKAGRPIPYGESKRHVLNLLFDHLNNRLYRRQALMWIKHAADRRGLTLAIYGNGWNRDPDLANHAHGPVEYGPELEDITRRARINLQIVPFICLHQRLLDGIAAGGFFLVREHPGDRLIPEICRYLESYCDDTVMTTQQARQAVPKHEQQAFDDLIRRAQVLADDADPVTLTRTRQKSYHVRADRPLLPRLEDVTFNDASSVERRLDEFLDHADRRDEIMREQRHHVLEHLTYTKAARRISREIHHLLAGTD